MMAYDDRFVIAIIHDGSPVRETSGEIYPKGNTLRSNGTVHLPFGSEYKVRLKNKNNTLRATARVWIDGRKVSNLGDFIIGAGETLDLERFLDNSMKIGNKFKFVPLSDNRVNDPTDSENGIVKVEFYRERVINPIGPEPLTIRNPNSWNLDNVNWTTDNFTYLSNKSYLNTNPFSSCYVNSISSSSPGATIEGSKSNQKFSMGDFFLTDAEPIMLTLCIRGISNNVNNEVVKSSPPQNKERFCCSCGKRRHKMSDKFCPRCGNNYNFVKE